MRPAQRCRTSSPPQGSRLFGLHLLDHQHERLAPAFHLPSQTAMRTFWTSRALSSPAARTAGTSVFLADRENGRAGRASTVRPHVSEWIHTAARGVRERLSLERLSDQVAQFPTYNEGWLKKIQQPKGLGTKPDAQDNQGAAAPTGYWPASSCSMFCAAVCRR